MSNKSKKSMAQRLRSAFKKSLLLAAAGTGVAGYHHYGTQEDLSVTITAVEAPSAQTPYAKIHTDRGTFTNTATWLHMKGDKTTQQIGTTLRAGMKVNLRVYGAHPNLAGFTPDDLGFYRNIIEVSAVTTRTPAPQAPARAPQPAPLVTTDGLRTQMGVMAEDDTSKPQTCADLANLDDLRQSNPQNYRDLAILERLPLTGKALFSDITLRKHFIRSCLVPYNPASTTSGEYTGKRLTIMRGLGSRTSFHEYYHAFQDINEHRTYMVKLTPQDAAVAYALSEASAVAYVLMAEREAKNHGIDIFPNADPSRMGADQNAATRAVFEQAYTAAFAHNAQLNADAREAVALQEAGRAVVRTLVLGDDSDWLRGYAQLAVENVNANAAIFGRNDGRAQDYKENRQRAYMAEGRVSASINIIPREFFATDADQHIARSLGIMGIRISAPVRSAKSTAVLRAS